MLSLRLNVLYVLALVSLTSLTDVKFGPVQVSEVVSLLGLVIVGPLLLFRAKFPNVKAERFAFLCLIAFFSLVSIGALIAHIRGGYFPPGDVENLLRQPGWIAGSRIFQLFLVYSCFAAIVHYASADRSLLRKCIRIYVYGLVLSAAYGIVSYVLMAVAGVEIGGAYGEYSIRLRAFFVEGGPFGLFAASGVIVIAAQWNQRYLSQKEAIVCGLVIGVALLLTQSKAAVFAIVVTVALAVCFSGLRSLRTYIVPIMLAGVVISVLAVFSGAGQALDTIDSKRQDLLNDPELIGDDPNVIAGRIAGSLIVPKMIMAHPILGVGIGNYSLMRNSPEYNQVLPAVDYWDLHGLGMYGLIAEIGILPCLMLVLFLLTPAFIGRRLKVPFALIMLCCFPVIAFIFGVQPTFLYPWVVSALGFVMVRHYRVKSNV